MKVRVAAAFRVVRVIDLEEIRLPNGEAPLRFRVEVLEALRKKGRRFSARVLRHETFRVQPTFPQSKGKPRLRPSDEDLLVRDFTRDWTAIAKSTPEEVLETVLRELREVFRE